MGLNLMVRQFEGHDEKGNLISKDIEKEIKFDGARYSWDREFASAFNEKDGFESITQSDIREENSYYDREIIYRPKNIDEAINWVNENVGIEGNKIRLLNLLAEMKNNEKIYIGFSY